MQPKHNKRSESRPVRREVVVVGREIDTLCVRNMPICFFNNVKRGYQASSAVIKFLSMKTSVFVFLYPGTLYSVDVLFVTIAFCEDNH